MTNKTGAVETRQTISTTPLGKQGKADVSALLRHKKPESLLTVVAPTKNAMTSVIDVTDIAIPYKLLNNVVKYHRNYSHKLAKHAIVSKI